jgi:hypothetical protein
MVSKHAMHANVSEFVRYAGEFHIQRRLLAPHHLHSSMPVPCHPDQIDMDELQHYPAEKYEHWLVIDNNSGTFGPKKDDLPGLAELFRQNFPGLRVEALDFQDPLLKQYVSQLKEENAVIAKRLAQGGSSSATSSS